MVHIINEEKLYAEILMTCNGPITKIVQASLHKRIITIHQQKSGYSSYYSLAFDTVNAM